MTIRQLPAGTRIYLTRKRKETLYIKPNKTLKCSDMYALYDVKVNGVTVIPRGTRFEGEWITESDPEISAQLQITRVFLCADGQDLNADSAVITKTSLYNEMETGGADHLSKISQITNGSNIMRRNIRCNNIKRVFVDNNRNSIYLEIQTNEIPVTVINEFVAFPKTDSIASV